MKRKKKKFFFFEKKNLKKIQKHTSQSNGIGSGSGFGAGGNLEYIIGPIISIETKKEKKN